MNTLSRLSLALCTCFATTGLLAQPQPVAFHSLSYEAAPSPDGKLAAGDYRNPIRAGFYPDPSICQVGSDYFLINSTFGYFPGIPIFQSRDLVNWHQLGNVISRPTQLPYAGLGVSRGIFAPAISHHDGTFYVVCTMIDAGGNFVVTAKDPVGPWSDPTWLHFEGIDPSLFFDDDGRAWMVNNGAPVGKPLYDGHRAIWVQEFDIPTQKMKGPRTVLVNGGVDLAKKPIWIEGPHLYKRDGWYYLSCAEGGTSTQHSQVVFRSRHVEGSFAPWSGNPILTQRDLSVNVPDAVTSTGHADLFQGPDKNWWAIFLGVRPYEGRFSPMGRETFLLPVKWTDDGWPSILPHGQRVPLVGHGPEGLIAKADAGAPTQWTANFHESQLDLAWIMLRSPAKPWWQVDAADGKLLLTAQMATLNGHDNPSFIARRIQHAAFIASTRLEVPKEPGVSAGLVLFQNETHHYFVGVHRISAGIQVVLEQANGGKPVELVQAMLSQTATVELRASVDHAKCSFEYSTATGQWQTLRENEDAKLLTTEVAGGFVGATFGLYARIDP
ncbi:MAG TPA: glycoside hydrolase family 43 protein [Lacunisphaera sp.]|jgi:alpha-N-arabinofuranosidase